MSTKILPRTHWPQLCARIEQILSGQVSLLPPDPEIKEYAQKYASQLIVRETIDEPGAIDATDKYHEVDVESLQLIRPRSIGVENVSMEAIQ